MLEGVNSALRAHARLVKLGETTTPEVKVRNLDDITKCSAAGMSSYKTTGGIPSSYRDYEAEAAEIVKNVIKYAVSVVQSEIKESVRRNEPLQPINWPSGQDFTVDKGKEVIQQIFFFNLSVYICSWRLHLGKYISLLILSLH